MGNIRWVGVNERETERERGQERENKNQSQYYWQKNVSAIVNDFSFIWNFKHPARRKRGKSRKKKENCFSLASTVNALCISLSVLQAKL